MVTIHIVLRSSDKSHYLRKIGCELDLAEELTDAAASTAGRQYVSLHSSRRDMLAEIDIHDPLDRVACGIASYGVPQDTVARYVS